MGGAIRVSPHHPGIDCSRNYKAYTLKEEDTEDTDRDSESVDSDCTYSTTRHDPLQTQTQHETSRTDTREDIEGDRLEQIGLQFDSVTRRLEDRSEELGKVLEAQNAQCMQTLDSRGVVEREIQNAQKAIARQEGKTDQLRKVADLGRAELAAVKEMSSVHWLCRTHKEGRTGLT